MTNVGDRRTNAQGLTGTYPDGSVTADAILDAAITETDIADEAITTPKLAANSVTAAHIVAGTITADLLAAELVLASLIKTAVDGVRVELDSAGLRAYGSDDNLLVNIPTDGSPVYVNAQIEATELVVTGDAVLQGTANELAAGSVTRLAGLQAPPSQAPSLAQGWYQVTLPIDPTYDDFADGEYFRGTLAYDAAGGAGGATKVFWTIGTGPTGGYTARVLELLASDRTVNRSLDISPTTPGAEGSRGEPEEYSVCAHGNYIYVLGVFGTYTNRTVKRFLKSTLALDATYPGIVSFRNFKATITLTSVPAGEDFRLRMDGTDSINFVHGTNLTAAAIQAELRTLSGDTGLTVTGTTDAGPFTVTGSDFLYHYMTFLAWDETSIQGNVVNNQYGDWNSARIASDGTNLFIADLEMSAGTHILKWNKYDSDMVKVGGTIDTTYDITSKFDDITVGNADFGAWRLVATGSSVAESFDSTGARQANEQFPLRTLYTTGITYGDALADGARFWSIPSIYNDPEATMTKHSTWVWTTASPIYWVAYSWYDSVGTTHETTVSPRASITMGRRKRIEITSATVPGSGGADEPDTKRFYMVPSATAPATTAMKLQATWHSGLVLADYISGGAAPPTTNGFITVGAAATLSSAANEWQLKGDGTTVGLSMTGHGAADHANLTRNFWLNAEGATLSAATFASLGTTPSQTRVVAYADAATQGAFWSFMVPADYASGDLMIRPIWSPGSTDAVAHTVRWIYNTKVLGTATDVTAAGTVAAFTGASATRTVSILVADTDSIALSTLAAGDRIRLMVQRDGAHANDSYVGVVNLVGLIVSYTANQ